MSRGDQMENRTILPQIPINHKLKHPNQAVSWLRP
jgi:hypothetical protein